jgi:hypothetical protein
MSGTSETATCKARGHRPTVAIDAVVTHHRDGFRSGVARFNEVLAQHLCVPLLGIVDQGVGRHDAPLLSFKVSELGVAERAALEELVSGSGWHGSVYLHEACGDELERRLIEVASTVYCGNHEIHLAVRNLNARAPIVWTPGLILDNRVFQPAEISVFSFGMAHKIRTDLFTRLRELLDSSGRTYTVFVSAANHETTSMRDSKLVFEELHQVYPRGFYFLGNLSDVAVFNYLQGTTFFSAFFEHGVRANNTSVASALELGAVVITNLDEHSPPEFRHMDNLIDINKCAELPTDPLVLKRLSVRAMETGRSRDWNQLVTTLTSEPAYQSREAAANPTRHPGPP